MKRQEILDQIKETLGSVPGWLAGLPDSHLEQKWASITWVFSDTALTSREKGLVAFGAAATAHCPY